jgi:hypothetical protein
MLHILAYFSNATPKFRHSELMDIANISAENNRRLGVTGLLCYRERNFVQFLEGEKTVVEALLERIKKDPRHTGVITMLSEPIEKRIFENWCMGLRNADQFEGEEKSIVLELFNVDLDRRVGGHVRLVEVLLDIFRRSPLK